MWRSDNPDLDVPLNACVVWDTVHEHYAVFVTTDMTKSAAQIIKTYEIRPEIEEDFRQLKDFWQLEGFKSTKINVIAFHIVCVLLGYLFFQLYTMIPEGAEYAGRSLPIILKRYLPKVHPYIIVYAERYFAVFQLVEMMKIYAECVPSVKEKIEAALET